MIKTLSLILFLYLFLGIAVFPILAADRLLNDSTAKPQIGIDKITFAPSTLLTSTKDNFTISAYLRTQSKEGETPSDFQDTVDNSERVVAFQLREWGIILGWSGTEKDDLSNPSILAVNYKIPLAYKWNDFSSALDFKYSIKKLPKSTLRKSLLDFGVVSITGILDREITWIFDFYGGLTANYIYVDMSSDVLTDMWKFVPFVGIRINVSPYYTAQIVSEIDRVKDDSVKDPIWTWHFGVSLGF
ncbi:MAG: hypothetical protein QG588_657 [Candidatus Poribacteria bacterium]|nr:hypothetical protein [Candidatus Poribacteria bacterium]